MKLQLQYTHHYQRMKQIGINMINVMLQEKKLSHKIIDQLNNRRQGFPLNLSQENQNN